MAIGQYKITSANRISAGETDTIWFPRGPRIGRCGVVLLHGSGNPQAFIDNTTQPASAKLADALADSGIACIAGDMGFQTWGNDTLVARIDSAWAALKLAVPTIDPNRICIVAGSMGASGGARYTQNNPSKVACFVGLIPLLDTVAFYQANPGAVANEVGVAWGVTAPAALPTRANIASTAGLAAGVPHLLGYSTADTVVLPAWVTSYAKKVGTTPIITDTTAGHSDAAIAGMPISTIGKFLVANGA